MMEKIYLLHQGKPKESRETNAYSNLSLSLEKDRYFRSGMSNRASLNVGSEVDLSLSVREHEVLCLLANGNSAQDVAGALFVSIPTVRSHTRNLMRKLNASNIPHAVTLAFQKSILSLDFLEKSQYSGLK